MKHRWGWISDSALHPDESIFCLNIDPFSRAAWSNRRIPIPKSSGESPSGSARLFGPPERGVARGRTRPDRGCLGWVVQRCSVKTRPTPVPTPVRQTLQSPGANYPQARFAAAIHFF